MRNQTKQETERKWFHETAPFLFPDTDAVVRLCFVFLFCACLICVRYHGKMEKINNIQYNSISLVGHRPTCRHFASRPKNKFASFFFLCFFSHPLSFYLHFFLLLLFSPGFFFVIIFQSFLFASSFLILLLLLLLIFQIFSFRFCSAFWVPTINAACFYFVCILFFNSSEEILAMKSNRDRIFRVLGWLQRNSSLDWINSASPKLRPSPQFGWRESQASPSFSEHLRASLGKNPSTPKIPWWSFDFGTSQKRGIHKNRKSCPIH